MLKLEKRSSSTSYRVTETMKKAQTGFKKHFKNLKEKMNEFKDK
jgi:hypothetical protein